MPIVGDHPESGIRFVFERPDGGPPWLYEGDAFTPEARFPMAVRVEAAGEVTVTPGGELSVDLAEKVRLLFRSLHKQAKDSPRGEPPRKVVRWRGEK